MSQWYYRVAVSVGHLTREPLEVLKSLFGGSITQSRDGYGFHWQWRVYSIRAVECVKAIQPYVVVKQAQSALLMEFWNICESMSRNRKGQFDHMRAETKELQSQMHAVMMGLNRRRERLNEKAPTGNAEGGAIVRTVANEKATETAEMAVRLRAV